LAIAAHLFGGAQVPCNALFTFATFAFFAFFAFELRFSGSMVLHIAPG
jgi:hypothetical protein